MAKKIHFLPIGAFAPDAPDFTGLTVREASGAIPVFERFRQLHKPARLGYVDLNPEEWQPYTGGFAHLLSEAVKYLRGMILDDPPTPDGWTDRDGGDDLEGTGYPVDDTRFWVVSGDSHSLILDVDENPAPGQGATGNLLHVRYRVQNIDGATAWDFEVEIRALIPGGIHTFNITGTGPDDDWVDHAEVLDNPPLPVSLMADEAYQVTYTAKTGFTPDVTADPLLAISDVEIQGWLNQDEEDFDLYLAVDEDPIDDADFVRTQGLGAQASEGGFLLAAGGTAYEIAVGDFTGQVEYRVKASGTGVALTVTLKQAGADPDNGDVIASWDHDPAPTTKTTYIQNLTAGEQALVAWDEPMILMFAWSTDGGSGSVNTYRPNGDLAINDWTDELGGTTNIYTSINDDPVDDTQYIQSGVGAGADPATFDFPLIQVPDEGSVTVYWRQEKLAGSPRMRVDALNGVTVVGSRTLNVTEATPTEKTLVFENIQDLDDPANFRVKFSRDPGAGDQVKITECWVEISEGGGEGFMYGMSVPAPPVATLNVSRWQFELGYDPVTEPGDQIKVFAGRRDALEEIDPRDGTITDRSGITYGATDEPKVWGFCSWGDWVLASNFVDKLQVWKPSAPTAFSDLVLTGLTGMSSKFVGVCSSHAFAANLNPGVDSSAKPYTVAVSAFGDPTRFELGDLNIQSGFFQLVAGGGQITGAISGEVARIFKANSVWRMQYVGPPRVFYFGEISTNIGCPHSRSIISVGNRDFFWGPDSIYMIEGAQGPPADIASGRVRKMLYDSEYEARSFRRLLNNDEPAQDSIVIGAYLPNSAVIIWGYSTDDERAYLSRKFILMDVNTLQMTILEDDELTTTWPSGAAGSAPTVNADGMNASALVGLPNSKITPSGVARDVLVLRAHGEINEVLTFTDPESYDLEIIVEKFAAPQLPGVRAGQSVTIYQVRPIYSLDGVEPGNEKFPPMTVTVRSAEDPAMSYSVQEQSGQLGGGIHGARDGWITLPRPVDGEFFEIELLIEAMLLDTWAIRDLLGFQVKYRASGHQG